jgi:hypothetical protein
MTMKATKIVYAGKLHAFMMLKIHEDSEEDVTSDMSCELNLLYYPQLINYFQKFFMPYIFIWSSLVLRKMDPDCQITKIDQGCIVKYFGWIKHVRGHQPIVPARHVLDSYKTVLANSIIFT